MEPSLNTSGPSVYGGHTPSTLPHGLNTSGPSVYGGHTPSTSPHGLNTSGPSVYGGHTPSTSPHGLNTSGPSVYGGHTPSTSPHGLNTSGPSPGRGHAAGPSASPVSTPDGGKAAHSSQNKKDASSSSDEGNIPRGQQAENAWTPCDGCKGEVERIIRDQRRIDEVISRIGKSFLLIHS